MNNKTKIALVTGGSRGLGKDMALRLAEKGLDVILTYNQRADDAQQVVALIEAAGRKAAALQLNTGDIHGFGRFADEQLATLRNHFGADHFDFLVNNAGHGGYRPINEVTEEFFDDLLNVHFKGVYFLTQRLIPLMNDGGGPRGIRANVVAPGAIMTDFGGGRLRNSQEMQKMVSSITALGRPGVAEDIGGVVAFLCTEDARWVNGQRIEVSGGMNV